MCPCSPWYELPEPTCSEGSNSGPGSVCEGPRERWAAWPHGLVQTAESDRLSLFSALSLGQTHLCFPVVAAESPLGTCNLVHPAPAPPPPTPQVLTVVYQ